MSEKKRKKKAAGIRTLQSMGFFNTTKTPVPAKRAKKTTAPVSIPCIGLSGADDPCIEAMLKHKLALGGGGQDPRKIAEEWYEGKLLARLTEEEWQVVDDKHYLMFRWCNDHQ